MNDYERIRSSASDKVRIGEALSFPVPIMREGAMCDGFFVYTVSKQTKIPNKPSAVICISENGADQVDASEYFDNVEFVPAAFESKSGARQIARRIEEVYADVRAEVAAGALGEASKEYAKLILAITQTCLMPYYEALAPELFAGLDSGGR